MLLCLRRAPLAGMVAGSMRVAGDEEGPGGHCNQLITVQCLAPQSRDPTQDLQSITATFQHLSASGWYWGPISASEARDALVGAAEGTFLVRDSSHPHYMFTLSVKTVRGPTNVRIGYSDGRFHLDCSVPPCPRLLSFSTVPALVQHYVGTSRKSEKNGKPEVDATLSMKDNAVLLKLRRPLHDPKTFPTLQHLVRLSINKRAARPALLPLPRPLLQYLENYPFHV